MNLLHMKYAVEIAETNSLNKAAERLYVGQSALSRAVKELETSLGVVLFERSAKGMTLTPDGEVFVGYARGVLKRQMSNGVFPFQPRVQAISATLFLRFQRLFPITETLRYFIAKQIQ